MLLKKSRRDRFIKCENAGFNACGDMPFIRGSSGGNGRPSSGGTALAAHVHVRPTRLHDDRPSAGSPVSRDGKLDCLRRNCLRNDLGQITIRTKITHLQVESLPVPLSLQADQFFVLPLLRRRSARHRGVLLQLLPRSQDWLALVLGLHRSPVILKSHYPDCVPLLSGCFDPRAIPSRAGARRTFSGTSSERL